jgi:DNA-binding GntR family transcriptional regulator
MDTSPDTSTYTDLHPRPSTSSYAYDQLKSLVLSGDVPLGIRLREEPLADRLGVSRTPVREALLRLFAEGFLTRHNEGGYRVVTPSAQAMANLYEVRRALELFAIRRTRPDGTPAHDVAALHALRDEWQRLTVDAPLTDPEFVILDEEFHAGLVEASGNTELADEVRRINQRIRPVRSHDFVTPGRIAATIEQHLAILERLLDGEAEEAADRLDRHIRESQAVVEAASIRALEKMLQAGEEAW